MCMEKRNTVFAFQSITDTVVHVFNLNFQCFMEKILQLCDIFSFGKINLQSLRLHKLNN